MADVDLDMLRRVTAFSALSEDQLERLVAAATVGEHPTGDSIIEQGGIAVKFFLLLEGTAVVERDGAEIAEVGPGDFLGEIGLLGGGRSTATVRTTSPVRVLTLQREDFWTLLEDEPHIALRILEVLCRRLAEEARAGHHGNLVDAGA